MEEPDIKLISAAPDLLASCKALLEIAKQTLLDIGGCDHEVGICCCGIVSDCETAKEAIDKAEGKP